MEINGDKWKGFFQRKGGFFKNQEIIVCQKIIAFYRLFYGSNYQMEAIDRKCQNVEAAIDEWLKKQYH